VFVAPSPAELVRMPLGWGGDDDSIEPTDKVLVFWELLYDGYGGTGFGVVTENDRARPSTATATGATRPVTCSRSRSTSVRATSAVPASSGPSST
jgi:hypothetical protein